MGVALYYSCCITRGMTSTTTQATEQEVSDACFANAMFLPIDRFDAVRIVRDENGYGATLVDSGAVGLGGTPASALQAAIECERALTGAA